ncbi:MAG: bifunctional phosphoribosylaminoimidazolecarboxamide formyltransferase/IMP cyclohydrolase PurH, partial [Bacteroidetes bacterium]|nr:bifunctional phosphoribosylaminoimidazolecarboxamide formyltransferase/IMP cyclohydrolase PurH [Bacteroidota bacterium]
MADTTLQFRSALISVYHKTGLDDIVKKLHALGVEIYSTGGTYDFLENLGIPAHKVEDLTSYPSILGGRVKTLHPKVFGGILGRRENTGDIAEMEQWEIPNFDLVVIDLYPFEETVQSGASPADIIEKIDIGGISLIRAAAKNFNHVVCIPSQNHYDVLNKMLMDGGKSTLQERQSLSADSFEISSRYDFAIWNYLSGGSVTPLRYGE